MRAAPENGPGRRGNKQRANTSSSLKWQTSTHLAAAPGSLGGNPLGEEARNDRQSRGRKRRPGTLKGEWFMALWLKPVVRFLQAEDGPTAVEYAVMLALIVVVCVSAITSLGNSAKGTFNNVSLNTAVSGS
jgi:pilus assembly protein Flp/PilA